MPFPIACGRCWACEHQLYSVCENSNPNAGIAEKLFGHPTAGIFGYSHITGGYAGGQAEYARVPYADVGPFNDYDYRLEMARNKAGASDVINFDDDPDIVEQLKELTGGRGPDAVIDAVGMEAVHGHGALHAVDRVKQATRMESDRGHALRDAILACRPAGIVSIIGVYGGLMDKFPTGALMNKGLTLRTGQCHVHRYMPKLYDHIRNGDIDPSFVVTHRLPLGEAPNGYETFKHKEDECVKVVLKPQT